MGGYRTIPPFYFKSISENTETIKENVFDTFDKWELISEYDLEWNKERCTLDFIGIENFKKMRFELTNMCAYRSSSGNHYIYMIFNDSSPSNKHHSFHMNKITPVQSLGDNYFYLSDSDNVYFYSGVKSIHLFQSFDLHIDFFNLSETERKEDVSSTKYYTFPHWKSQLYTNYSNVIPTFAYGKFEQSDIINKITFRFGPADVGFVYGHIKVTGVRY